VSVGADAACERAWAISDSLFGSFAKIVFRLPGRSAAKVYRKSLSSLPSLERKLMLAAHSANAVARSHRVSLHCADSCASDVRCPFADVRFVRASETVTKCRKY
jgi:hypothetical protein